MSTNQAETIKNKIFKALSKTVTIVCAASSPIGLLVTCFNDNIYLKIASVSIFTLLILGFGIYIFKTQYNMNIYRRDFIKNNDNQVLKISELLHNHFHMLRNYMAQLNNRSVGNNEFQKNMEKLCDNLSKLFSTILDADMNVCIKTLLTNEIMSNNISKWKIQTFCRSTNSPHSRFLSDHQPVRVADNYDFQTIISDTKTDFFATPNLEHTIQQLAENGIVYNNSTEKYLEKYHSTIVIPIRIQNHYANDILLLKKYINNFHVIGFLCIDSLETFSDTEISSIKFKHATQYAKFLGDSLYNVMELNIVSQLNNHSTTNDNDPLLCEIYINN